MRGLSPCPLNEGRFTEPGWVLATSHVERAGWSEVELLEAPKVAPEMLDVDPAERVAYERAIAEGSAIMIFAEPV